MATFWEQFKVSIHDHTSLSKAEKLAYDEAVESLKTGYDRPQLVHHRHMNDS